MESRDDKMELAQNLWKKNKKHAIRAHKEKTDDKSQQLAEYRARWTTGNHDIGTTYNKTLDFKSVASSVLNGTKMGKTVTGYEKTIRDLNAKFKKILSDRGGIGIRSLGRLFRSMDNNGNHKLDYAEFINALATFGLHPKGDELHGLMKFYDVDGDGNISFDEFLSGLKDELTPRRLAMVNKAFKRMDKDNSGKLTASDIAGIYDVS